MAWRIDEQVIRGAIDNRTRGRVSGEIWFVGRDKPVELDFAGNAWRDVAGRRLEFVNPHPRPGNIEGLVARQTGVIGDCTASRKVKVPDIPMDQIGEYYAARKPWPWHWGNSLYLEWFSAANGRVVIESASYQLTIGPDTAWEMTAAEEEQQRRANAEAMAGFFQQLGEAMAADRSAKGEIMGVPLVDANPGEADEAADDDTARAESSEGESGDRVQPARDDWMDTRHPLADRAAAFSVRLGQKPEELGWMPAGATEEHPVGDLVLSVENAAGMLAGALNGRPWPPPVALCTKTIMRLKRARGLLDHALLAAEYCGQEQLVGAEWLAETQREVNAIRHACDLLTVELRTQLERGVD